MGQRDLFFYSDWTKTVGPRGIHTNKQTVLFQLYRLAKGDHILKKNKQKLYPIKGKF